MNPNQVSAAIENELKALRKSPGPMTPLRFARLRILKEHLGHVDDRGAMFRLLEVANLANDDDIRTAIATIGYDQDKKSFVEERYSQLAAAKYVNERTIVRASNRGLAKLAHIISTSEDEHRPVLECLAVQSDGAMHLKFHLHRHQGDQTPLIVLAELENPSLVFPAEVQEISPSRIVADGQRVEFCLYSRRYGGEGLIGLYVSMGWPYQPQVWLTTSPLDGFMFYTMLRTTMLLIILRPKPESTELADVFKQLEIDLPNPVM